MRIYVGAALIAVVWYVVGLMLPGRMGEAVCDLATVSLLLCMAMTGVELIKSWLEARRHAQFVEEYKRENPNWDR